MATISGTPLANRIDGTAYADTIKGLGGNDTLYGRGGNDVIYGSAGNDFIDGGTGDDRLKGGTGNDQISGGDGNDRILGGLGADRLTGGAGSDTFIYWSLAELSTTYGAEFITDWSQNDRIDLSAIDANETIDGNQAFQFANYSFGHPPTVTAAGTLTIGGFGGELWILAYTDNLPGADLMINLWSDMGESALTADRIIF